MVRVLAFVLSSTALAACATQPPPAAVAPTAPLADAAPIPAPAAPKPTYGIFGFDTAGMDRSIAPGDNFYQYANGTWARTTAIPADKSNYGMFTVLDDLSKERTRKIIEDAARDPNSKIGIAYATFLDTAAIESKGLAPIAPWLNEIRALSRKSDYPVVAARADRMGISGPFAAFVNVDDKQNDQYILNMLQSGIGMPDRDYYLKNDAKIVETRGKYLTFLTQMLTLAGEANGAARAKAILDYETRIARSHWTQVDSRDATKTYNKMTIAQLQRRAPGFNFRAYLDEAGARVDQAIVYQPSAFAGIAQAVSQAPLQVLKDQLIVNSLVAYSAYLPKAVDDAAFAFYGTALSGTPQQEERWKRGVNFTTRALSDEIGQIYVQRHFPPETKAAADELVRNVVAAMGRRIDQLPWMEPQTKVRARAKLANFTTKIGYPDRWRDYSALEMRRGDALGNAMRAAEFEHEYQLGKLGGPVRRWEWFMTPMTINAYANFNMSEIVFPAAILQPPFFDPNADPAINYGGIGAVIGHEISHHFDDQGAKYDEHGRLADWWTPNDIKAFGEAGKALIAQYNAYEPLPGKKVNGELTLGENIGDLAGLTIAYEAYKASLGGREAPVIDGTTGDQRFYLGWAQIWRRNYREPNLLQRLITDPHAPSPQRVAIVRNLDPWYSAFNVVPGQGLYLAPAQRVRIW
ncbi:MAG TPA: M13-type metalloendopeptidase [Sphingomicrobium sp.]|nr:M13-type metalloendopeptidase [Sphingomicrobium sp.]